MTAGGRRTGPRSKKRWGQTTPLLAPPPPPDGIDLVVRKLRADDQIVRPPDEVEAEERARNSDFENTISDLAEISRPERDQHGRIVVDRAHALIGAVVVAIAAGVACWLLIAFLQAPATTP
jgi:hypothetical protein